MLQILSRDYKRLEQIGVGEPLPTDALWYDLLSPSQHEIEAVQAVLKISVPTLEEMQEIEESSRLYQEDETLYMISVVIANSDLGPLAAPVTFILSKTSLLTIRYSDPKPFNTFEKKINKNGYTSKETIFLGLMDTIAERIADLLEMNSAEIDKISREIFKGKHAQNQRAMREVLAHLGKTGDLNSKVRESLETIDRQLIFYHNQVMDVHDKKTHATIKTLQQDVKSLVDYGTFLFGKIDFLLNATLGFIDIEQNAIIKIFSVGAVIFLPPMLIASIYGMNFAKIPELNWIWGYPFALVLMVISAILPYCYFKRKGWL